MSCYSTKGQGRLATADPMGRRIKENPRYQHVQSSLDTGKSLSSQQKKLDEINANYKFRKNEIFKRMKVTTFGQLVIQIHRLADLDADILDTSEDPYEQPPVPQQPQEIGRTGLNRVIHGMGELSVEKAAVKQEVTDSPYLLLDVRDMDEYDQCRIIGSKSYPKTRMSNSTNYETKEMFQAKNKEGKVIILYDNDETIAPDCATVLVQRGYDNIFILSGGLKIAYKVFPRGFITGSPPQAVTGTKLRGPQHPATKTSFSTEDIDEMDDLLDEHIKSTQGSSCASASRSASRRSVMSKADKGNPWK